MVNSLIQAEVMSTLVRGFRLDTGSQTMVVYYQDGGVAQYEGVTLTHLVEILEAESAGQKFLELFRNRVYTKLREGRKAPKTVL